MRAFPRWPNLQCPLVLPAAESGGGYEEGTECWYQNLVSKFEKLRLILSWWEKSTPRTRFSFVGSAESMKTCCHNKLVRSSLHFSSRSPPESIKELLMHNCFREPRDTIRTVGACSSASPSICDIVVEILRWRSSRMTCTNCECVREE